GWQATMPQTLSPPVHGEAGDGPHGTGDQQLRLHPLPAFWQLLQVRVRRPWALQVVDEVEFLRLLVGAAVGDLLLHPAVQVAEDPPPPRRDGLYVPHRRPGAVCLQEWVAEVRRPRSVAMPRGPLGHEGVDGSNHRLGRVKRTATATPPRNCEEFVKPFLA